MTAPRNIEPRATGNRLDLASLPKPPAWTEYAICSETHPDEFFPDAGRSTAAAKAMCRRCEVQTECLEYALANDERHGIWGGLVPAERVQLRNASGKTGGRRAS